MSASTSWIAYYRPKAKARLRLFCFPYAGGAASLFRNWQESLPATVEVCPVQLPGRENRIREQSFDEVGALVQTLSSVLQPFLDRPFAFWGHSMGALISFELARQFRRENMPGLLHLFISGHRAPQLPNLIPSVHQLPETEFIKVLRQLNGTPEAVLQNAELMQLMMPSLRADFALVERYTYTPDEPIDCSISVFGGLQDTRVLHDDLKAWREQTHHTFNLRMFLGDHFYLHDYHSQLLSVMSLELMQLL